MTSDLSAFYFDIRKDALYCDPLSSTVRKSALTVIDQVFRCVVTWIAPILAFTAEEAWLARDPEATSVHLETFPDVDPAWRNERLAERWAKVRRVRRVITGALEIERAQKRIGASLEAAPAVHISDDDLWQAVQGLDLAEIAITSGLTLARGEGPADGLPARGGEGRRGGARQGAGPQMRPLLEDHRGCGRRPGLPGRDASRCGRPARMGSGEGGGVTPSRFGLWAALLTLVLDQATKLYVLFVVGPAVARAAAACALSRPHRGLESRHLLWAVPAEHRSRPLDPRRRLDRGGRRTDRLDPARPRPVSRRLRSD